MQWAGRKQSKNVDDRRSDPPGATRFSTEPPTQGDATYRPWVGMLGVPAEKTLPYEGQDYWTPPAWNEPAAPAPAPTGKPSIEDLIRESLKPTIPALPVGKAEILRALKK